MPSFHDFLKEDLELIVSLPYRVGIFVSRADDAISTRRDEKREARALRAVLESLGKQDKKCPFLAEVAEQSLSHEDHWPAWRAKKGLAEDIARSLKLMEARLPAENVKEFRRALFHIGCVVAQAYGEKDGDSEALAGQLIAKLSDRLFNPLDRNPENISAAEKAALQKLKETLLKG